MIGGRDLNKEKNMGQSFSCDPAPINLMMNGKELYNGTY